MLINHPVYIISVSAEGLANDSISDERRAALAQDGKDSREVQLRALGSKAQLVKWLLYALVLWLLKSSLLHFFAVRLSVCSIPSRLKWLSSTNGMVIGDDRTAYVVPKFERGSVPHCSS